MNTQQNNTSPELPEFVIILSIGLIVFLTYLLVEAVKAVMAWWAVHGDLILSVSAWTLLAAGLATGFYFLVFYCRKQYKAYRIALARAQEPAEPFRQLRDAAQECTTALQALETLADDFLAGTKNYLDQDLAALNVVSDDDMQGKFARHLHRRIEAHYADITIVTNNKDTVVKCLNLVESYQTSALQSIDSARQYGHISPYAKANVASMRRQTEAIADEVTRWHSGGVIEKFMLFSPDELEFEYDLNVSGAEELANSAPSPKELFQFEILPRH